MSANPPHFPPQPQPGPYGHQQPGYGPPPPAAPQPGVIPLATQTLGTVYSGAWRTVKLSTGAMLGQPSLWFTLAALLLSVPLTVWAVRFLNFVFSLRMAQGSAHYLGAEDLKAITLWILQDMVLWTSIGALFYIVLAFVGTAITVAPTMRATVGLPTGAGQAWRLLKPALPRILLAGFLLWVLGVAVMIVFAWLSYLWIVGIIEADQLGGQAGVDAAVSLSLSSTWFSLFGYVIQIGITLLSIRFIYTLPAMVLENLGLFAALKRSWNLIKGRYWQVLGTIVLGAFVIGFVVGLFLSLVVTLAVFAGMFTMDPQDVGASLTSLSIWLGVVVFITVAISLISMFLLLPVAHLTYVDARIRKENLLHELMPVALQDQTLAAARAGDAQALSLTAEYVPCSIPHDRRTV